MTDGRPGRAGTAVLFWDYDTEWGAERSRSGLGPRPWGPDEFTCTERLLELHAEHGIPACFAVVGAAAEPGERPWHDPAQVRAIHAAGHEVASHSHLHEWLPGLGRAGVRETMRRSRESLEQCIGAAVTTFVPPYNQPFDFPARMAISLSERREARTDRIGLPLMCQLASETGYLFCRVSYRPLPLQLAERALRRSLERPVGVERIGGVRCLRLNTEGGFDGPSMRMLDRSVAEGGIAVLYGHPHSLHSGNSQDERFLVPMLKRMAALREQGLLRVTLPRELTWP